jgi:hypothetical protein
MHLITRPTLAAVVLVALAAGCDKKDESSSAPAATGTTMGASASALSPSVAEGKSVKFVIGEKGTASIDMPAPKEHIKADTSASAGNLDVDLTNLANTRGEVRIDLSTIKTHTFGNDSDATQTKHALTWLEVGGDAPQEVREPNRWVVYAIRSIDGLSAADVTKVAPTKEGTDDVRTVDLTAHGDFLLHGHKVASKEAPLEVKFHYPAGAAGDSKPTSVDISSKVPLHVVLGDHDVKPRDNFGKIAQGAFGLLGTKVAETADVSIHLTATPAP